MVCCSAYGCSNRSEKKKPGLTFHRFPKNEARRAAWVKAVKRKDWTPSSVSSLCSNHFLPDDFDRTSLSCVRLREHAVPSVFSDSPSYTSPKVIKKMDLTKRKSEEVATPAFAPPQENAEEIICEPILVPQPMEDYEDVSSGDELAQLRKEVEELKRELKRVNDLYLGARRKIKTLQQAKRRHDKGKTDTHLGELVIKEEPSSSEELGKGPKHGHSKDVDVSSPLSTHSGDGEDSLTIDSEMAEGHWDEPTADSPRVTAGSVHMGFDGTRNGYVDSECRTCYMSCQSTKHIFTEEESGKLLYEIINYVYKLGIYPDDGLSEYICNICHQSVLEFQRVKKTSHEGQVALTSIWRKLSKEGKSMHNLCRLCVNDSNFSKNIFKCKHHGVLLYQVINGLCGLNLSEDDGLPSYLCSPCFAKMVEFSELKAFAQRGKATVSSKGFGMSQILLKRLSQPPVNGEGSMPATGVPTDHYLEPGSTQEREEEMQEEEDWSVDFSLAPGAGGAGAGIRQQRVHSCRYCGKGFESEYELIEHIRVHEGEQPPFPCYLCGKTFSRRTNLKVHLRRHSGEKPYPCDHCGKPFASRSALNLHSLTHTGHRPHGCKVCGRRFVSVSNLRKHEKLVHLRERPFKCDTCGEDFASSWSFKSHYRKHKLQKKEDAPQKSSCDIQCGIKCEISAEQPSCNVGLDLSCNRRTIPPPLESVIEEVDPE